jgi:hypothetical protein
VSVSKIGDYLKAIPHKWLNFSQLVPGCPSAGGCRNTVTLCGTCVERSELGNLIFGMSARLAGLGNGFTYVVRHDYAEGLQQPWDQAVAGVGYRLAETGYWPIYTGEMCDRFRNLTGGWKGLTGERNAAPWDWKLVQDETIKECKACDKEVPFSTPHTIPAYAGAPEGPSPYGGRPDYIYYTEQIPEGLLDYHMLERFP